MSDDYDYIRTHDENGELRHHATSEPHFKSTNTDEINLNGDTRTSWPSTGGSGTTFIEPGDSISTINTALSSPGEVVFSSGEHFVSDRVEVTSSDVSLIVSPGAHLKIQDSASPTIVTDGSGNDRTFLIYSSGNNRVSIDIRGTVDGNNANHTRGSAFYIGSQTGGRVELNGGSVVDVHDGGWLVDSTEVHIPHFWTADITSSVRAGALAVEGCTNCHFGNIGVVGYGEGLDLNAANDGCTVGVVWGHNTTHEILDLNGSPRTHVGKVVATGTAPENILTISGGSGARFTAKTVSNANGITIEEVSGTSTGDCLHIYNNGKPIKDLTVKGIDVTSTGSDAIWTRVGQANGFDGLRLEGRASTTETVDGTFKGWLHKSQGNQIDGASVDLDLYSEANSGCEIQDINNLSGDIRATNCGSYGVILNATSASVVNGVVLSVIARDNGADGFRINDNGAGVADVRVSGVAKGNGYSDVRINGGTETQVDMNYGTRTDNATRTIWNGTSQNSGDPRSTGQWNGHLSTAYNLGVHVEDTSVSPSDIYIPAVASWRLTA